MLEQLKQEAYQASLELPRRGLVTYTWENVPGIDWEQELIVIKPSGVEYEDLRPEDLVVLDLKGRRMEGKLNPPSDTKTHPELYRTFSSLGGIVHAHSLHAVAWTQAGEDIPRYGIIHTDYSYGPTPRTRRLTSVEAKEDCELNTDRVITETFEMHGINPVRVPGVICYSHGPLAWGKDAAQAVYHAVVLEEMARMIILTRQVNPHAPTALRHVREEYFLRRHGPNSHYGQNK